MALAFAPCLSVRTALHTNQIATLNLSSALKAALCAANKPARRQCSKLSKHRHACLQSSRFYLHKSKRQWLVFVAPQEIVQTWTQLLKNLQNWEDQSATSSCKGLKDQFLGNMQLPVALWLGTAHTAMMQASKQDGLRSCNRGCADMYEVVCVLLATLP